MFLCIFLRDWVCWGWCLIICVIIMVLLFSFIILLLSFLLISLEEKVMFSKLGKFRLVGVVLWLNIIDFCIGKLIVFVVFFNVLGILNVILVNVFWSLKYFFIVVL